MLNIGGDNRSTPNIYIYIYRNLGVFAYNYFEKRYSGQGKIGEGVDEGVPQHNSWAISMLGSS